MRNLIFSILFLVTSLTAGAQVRSDLFAVRPELESHILGMDFPVGANGGG